MAQITYADKSTMNTNSSIPAINKCQASDMNEIKSVVNGNYTELLNAINDKNIISVGLNANTNVTVSATWTHYSVPINTLKASIGTKLTFNSSTHRVIVGDGVNNVKMGCYTLIRGIATGLEFNVRKNGTTIGNINVQPSNTSIFENGAITDMLVSVSSGDYFDVTVRAGATGTIVVAGGASTGITFEVIN